MECLNPGHRLLLQFLFLLNFHLLKALLCQFKLPLHDTISSPTTAATSALKKHNPKEVKSVLRDPLKRSLDGIGEESGSQKKTEKEDIVDSFLFISL